MTVKYHELPSNKRVLLQHKQNCPNCNEDKETWLMIIGQHNMPRHQCTDCLTVFTNVYNHKHKLIAQLIEDDDDDKEYLN